MKRTISTLCFIISIAMCCGLVAQNNDAELDKTSEGLLLSGNSDSDRTTEWVNSIKPFVGVWSLENTVEDEDGNKEKVYPGTFIAVHEDAAYTIFVHTNVGAVITSQGNIIVDSPDVFIEVISHHVNSSLVGVSNRIDYKIDSNYLHKSFWIEKDRFGDDYKRQVNETWKRAKMPLVVYE